MITWKVELKDHPEGGEKSWPWIVGTDGDTTINLYIDGAEWCLRIHYGEFGFIGGNGIRLARVIELAPDFRDEAIGMTRSALIRERANLASALSDGLAALAAENDERANELLDDLRTWGTDHLQRDLTEAGVA